MKILQVLMLATLVGCESARPCHQPSASPSEAQQSLSAGIAALHEGQLELGIEQCERAIEAGDASPAIQGEAHRWLVHGYTRAYDPESAVRHADQALQTFPEDAWLHYARGIALLDLDRREEATDALSQAIRHDPTHIKAYQWRALLAQQEGRHADAIIDLERALELIATAAQDALDSWGASRESLTAETTRALAECRAELGG